MRPVSIRNEDELISEIIRVADESRDLGAEMRRKNRNMTKAEAYKRISASAGLLKAILEYVK